MITRCRPAVQCRLDYDSFMTVGDFGGCGGYKGRRRCSRMALTTGGSVRKAERKNPLPRPGTGSFQRTASANSTSVGRASTTSSCSSAKSSGRFSRVPSAASRQSSRCSGGTSGSTGSAVFWVTHLRSFLQVLDDNQ